MRRGTGNRRRNAKDDAADAARRERADRVFRLRCQGLSFRKIAAIVGIHHDTANEDFKAAVKARPLPELDAMRAEADQNLRDVQRWMRKPARYGSPKAAEALTKAIAQHAKIFGYEAPKKTEHSGPDGGPMTFATAPAILIPPEREPQHEPEPSPAGEEPPGEPPAAS